MRSVQDEYLLLLKMRTAGYRLPRVWALCLSLMVHAALLVWIFIGGILQPGHAGLADFNAASLQVITIDLSKSDGAVASVNDARKTAHNLGFVSVDAGTMAQAQKDSSILPALLPATPYYYSAKDLTQKPLVTHDVPTDMRLIVPDVPAQAATLQILINEYGEIDQVKVENSLLPDAAQKTVVDAFAKIRFHPGEINGIPVKSQLRIEIMLEDIEFKQ